VPDQEGREIGVLLDHLLDEHVCVVEQLVVVGVERPLPFRLSVPAVVEPVGPDPRLVELVGEIVVAALMLGQSVDDHRDRLRVFGDLLVIEEPGTVIGFDHL